MNPGITLTFAGDESGDTSFSFKRGASRFFVIAMIATEVPEELRLKMQELKAELRLPEAYEFKFHKLTGKRMGKQVFRSLVTANFKAWAILVDKTGLTDSYKLLSGLDFYLYFVTELIQQIPIEEQNGATLILDEFGGKEKFAAAVRRVMKARSIHSHFKKILARDSEQEPLIQIADLIAGAISHRDAIEGTELAEIIQPKIKKVIDFPYK